MLTVASLNARGFPLAGSQVAERYGVIGAGFDAGLTWSAARRC
jgi:hypothetical protein